MRALAACLVSLTLLYAPAFAYAATDFNLVDMDDDEFISFEEASASNDAWTEETFEAADQDEDDQLSEGEYTEGLKNLKK